MPTVSSVLATVAAASVAISALGAEPYFQVEYPPSTEFGQLQYGVTYTVSIPEGVERVRAVIVHQHGCGVGACRGGATAAYDLHWQALARKWDCALLGPSYHQPDETNCQFWCDPRNGSEAAFLRALDDLAAASGHAELATVPWCLWGHSGGGTWASLMQTLHPERIVAIWFRSGTAFSAWQSGELPVPTLSEAMYEIPMMCNPGAKEKTHERFHRAWDGTLAMFRDYRAKGAPIGFAPDPNTSHECGESRYLAIPFFDACLALRLPPEGSNDAVLRPIDQSQSYLAPLLSDRAVPAAAFEGETAESVWLPDRNVAAAWSEYVRTGATGDTTPPPAPYGVTVTRRADPSANRITWKADADFESGLGAFRILRDGQPIATVPEKPVSRFGRPLFQKMSYHDTPEAPLPEMSYDDAPAPPGQSHAYQIIAVNSVGLESKPSAATGAD